MLSETAYHQVADVTLDYLAGLLEDHLPSDHELDYESGVITWTLADGRQYVLNKHGVTRQLWLSSPLSGAWHFALYQDSETNQLDWCSIRDGQAILSLLRQEWVEKLHIPLPLSVWPAAVQQRLLAALPAAENPQAEAGFASPAS